jgi:hypothetical protein
MTVILKNEVVGMNPKTVEAGWFGAECYTAFRDFKFILHRNHLFCASLHDNTRAKDIPFNVC